MKKTFSLIMLCTLLSTGCSKDKTPPSIELLQKDVIATDSNYDPTENVLSVEDDVDGILKYAKGKGNVAGTYTMERRNANDYGYTAVVTATDKAGNTATKKFSVVYDDLIEDVIKSSNLNPEKSDGTESSKPNSIEPSDEVKKITVENTTNHDRGSPEESNNQVPAPVEQKKIKLAAPYGITASTDAKGWTIQWSAVDNADYYEIRLDGSQPQRANTNSYIYDTSQITSAGNHTITIKAYSVNSTYTESEEGSGVVQYEPQLKTIPVMYIQGESTYVDSGNPTVDVYVGMDYTYQDLDSMAGGFAAASQRTLNDPTGTVHIYDTTTSIQIYLNEQY